MKFNREKFRSTSYVPRTTAVPVPELKDMFEDLGDDETPTFTVQSLSRIDFIRMQDAVERNQNMRILLEAVGGGNAKEAIESLKERLGWGEEVPEGAAREMTMLEAGVSDPQLEIEDVVKIYDTFPMVVARLINEISQLTNAGWMPGKPKRSTPKAALKTA